MKTKIIKRFFTVIFLWPVYLFTYLIPRSKQIWVFGSFSKTFADNSKYLFLQQHYSKEAAKITPVWITTSPDLATEMRRNGYKSYTKNSLPGFYYCIRASVYVYSWSVRDINFWLSGGARLVSLWHGIPFKLIGSDMQSKRDLREGKVEKFSVGALLRPFLHPTLSVTADVMLSPHATEVSAIFKRVFAPKRIFHSIYPRVEHFILPDEAKKKWIDLIHTAEEARLLEYIKKFDDVWVYMPTFRDNKDDKEKMFSQEAFDFDKLNPILQKNNILLLVKYHYVAMRNIVDKDKFSNVVFINNKMDVYVILPFTSGLITDYSSVLFDYMLLQKPMLFYIFDLESYQNNSREFYYPYNDTACGTKVNTFSEVCRWFEEGTYKNASFDYQPYIERFWGKTEKPYLLEQLHEAYNRN